MLTSELTVQMLKYIVRGHVCCPLIHDSFIHSRNRNVVETLRPLCFWVIVFFFLSKQKNKDAAPTPASVATSVQQHKEEDEETTVAVSISPQTAKMSAQVSVLTSFTHDDHGMYWRYN